MVGLGGVQVELIKDVMFSLHQLRDRDPDCLLAQLKVCAPNGMAGKHAEGRGFAQGSALPFLSAR
jgi:hypothetical protein